MLLKYFKKLEEHHATDFQRFSTDVFYNYQLSNNTKE